MFSFPIWLKCKTACLVSKGGIQSENRFQYIMDLKKEKEVEKSQNHQWHMKTINSKPWYRQGQPDF